MKLLPKTLSSASKEFEIRFDPARTAIHITNIVEFTKLAFNKIGRFSYKENDGLNWLCPKSYLGQNIRSLVVDSEHLWDATTGVLNTKFDDYTWAHTLRYMFKDVEKIICLTNPEDYGYLFNKYDYWPDFSSDLEDEEDSDTSSKKGSRKEKKKDAKSKKDKHGRWLIDHSYVADISRLNDMVNDVWANIVDELRNSKSFEEIRGRPDISEAVGNWEATSHKRPTLRLYFSEKFSYKDGLPFSLKCLPIKPRRNRFDFTTLHVGPL